MSRTRPHRIIALIVALFVATAACAAEEPTVISSGNHPATSPQNIVETAEAADFTILVAALEATGLDEVLSGEGPFTVFAPTDAAFDDLPDSLLDLLLEPENAGLLEDILTYHVVDGLQRAGDLLDEGQVTTLQGDTITVEEVEIEVEVDPTDPAPDTETETETEVRAGDATVTAPNQLATNGIIHVIDTVLVPPGRSADLEALIDEIPEPTDIVSTAQEAGQFSSLLAALDAAGLTDTLQGDGPFTVFAPTDAAFADLSPEQQALLENPDVLEAVLLAHVATGEVSTDDVLVQRFITTLEGQTGRLVHEGGGVYSFGGVELQVTDIEATNGIIHVIDSILLPDSVRGPGLF